MEDVSTEQAVTRSERPPADQPPPPRGLPRQLVAACHEDGRPYSRDALSWRFSKITGRAGGGATVMDGLRHTRPSIPAGHRPGAFNAATGALPWKTPVGAHNGHGNDSGAARSLSNVPSFDSAELSTPVWAWY